MKVLGLLSGTSVDAIDAALAEIEADGDTVVLRPLGHAAYPWPPDLRAALLGALPPANPGVGTWCRLDAEAGRAFGAAATRALAELGDADLVCSHGQTLHHWVEDGRALGTLQVGNPAWIHAATTRPVVSDLRTADLAAGGQGAPLASTLDALWLGDLPTAALNLGGIANVTLVGPDRSPVCGDTGPANCLLDSAAYDAGLRADVDGRLALAGRVDQDALVTLLADPYYARTLPKSTGREYFHPRYVSDLLGDRAPRGPDLFATLVELSARTVADALAAQPPVRRVVVSGGGVHNPALMARLSALLPAPVVTSDTLGLPADAKEGYLFALLGYLSAHGLPGTVPGVTGATRATVLGSLTPPHAARPAPLGSLRNVRVAEEE